MLFSLRCLAIVTVFASITVGQTWQTQATFPTNGMPRSLGAAVNTGSQIFLLGGTPFDSGGNGAAHLLQNGSWVATTATEGMFYGVGAAIDNLGRIIVFAGIDPSNGDPGDGYSWTIADGNNGGISSRSSSAPAGLFAVATDSSALVYSLGGGPGSNPTSGNANSTQVERYDGAADQWSVLAPMLSPVADACACYDGLGHILVFGGFDASGVRTANVAQYDIATNSWSDTVVPNMSMPLSGARAVLGADGRVYVIGGSNGTLLNSTLILDPTTATWSSGPSMSTAREHFGCVLDNNGNILVLGGTTTNTSESLFTPTCPSITRDPSQAEGFLDQSFGFDVGVSGTGPFTYQWFKDGIALVDGVTATGSTVVGANEDRLGIVKPGFSDLGAYACQVNNACGSTVSATASVTLKNASQVPGTFIFTNLHPGGADSSRALSVDGGNIGGSANFLHPTYGYLGHAFSWDAATGVGQDLTPANSVGGGINDVKNGTLAGWWWWPYSTPQGIGYYRHACVWENNGATHIDVQPTSWEIGTLLGTDGSHHVGNLVYSDGYPTQYGAFYWPTSTLANFRLDPVGHTTTQVYAIEMAGSLAPRGRATTRAMLGSGLVPRENSRT